MALLFVTGSNAGFFNSLLICLQSFAERLPGHRLLVCDYGMNALQTQFLRQMGILVERPPSIAADADVFVCKAALLRYLRHGGHRIENYDAVVWVDGDLTLMGVGMDDFQAVLNAMQQTGAQVAICGEPLGKSMGQMIDHFPDPAVIEPFTRMMTALGINPALPYFSTGLFFCRSVAVLDAWDQLTHPQPYHPLFEQNMFNIVLHRDRVPVLAMDCEEWQAQGQSLGRIVLTPDGQGRNRALIGPKNIKTLHSTSPNGEDLLIVKARMTVQDKDLTGIFKLLFAEPLRMVQLHLLAVFIHLHGKALMDLGICRPSPQTIEGFQFSAI